MRVQCITNHRAKQVGEVIKVRLEVLLPRYMRTWVNEGSLWETDREMILDYWDKQAVKKGAKKGEKWPRSVALGIRDDAKFERPTVLAQRQIRQGKKQRLMYELEWVGYPADWWVASYLRQNWPEVLEEWEQKQAEKKEQQAEKKQEQAEKKVNQKRKRAD